MLGIAIDAVVLIVLLKVVNDEDVGFGLAIIVALVTAFGTQALALGLESVIGLGIIGFLIAAVIAALLLGVAVSALFGVETKRSFLIATLFMVIHISVGVAFQLLFRTY